jgi:hypothetical protein
MSIGNETTLVACHIQKSEHIRLPCGDKMHADPSYANVDAIDASSINHRTILFETRNIRYVRCKQREVCNAVLPISFVRVSLNVCIYSP